MASQALIPTSQLALDAYGSGWHQATSMAAPNAKSTSLLDRYNPKPQSSASFCREAYDLPDIARLSRDALTAAGAAKVLERST